MLKKILLVMVTILSLSVLALGATAQEQNGASADQVAAVTGAAAIGDGNLGPHESSRGFGVALAIGLGLGLAAMGGASAQGRATAAALEGLSRNPGSYDRVFTPFILGMVLIESLVIYSLVISLILLGSLGG